MAARHRGFARKIGCITAGQFVEITIGGEILVQKYHTGLPNSHNVEEISPSFFEVSIKFYFV